MSELPVPMDERRLWISADPEILQAIRRAPGPRWSLEATLQTLQLLAIVIGGSWALFLFVTFQHENNSLALDAARATLRQAQLTAETSKLTIAKESQAPLITTDVISVHPLPSAPGWYLARYDYSIRNSGGGAIDIASAIGDAFVGSTALSGSDGIVVNDIWDAGAVTWKKVAFEGHASRSAFKPGMILENGDDRVPAVLGGGGTGSLNTTESAEATMTVLIHAKPTDFIGFRVRFTAVDKNHDVRGHRLHRFELISAIGSAEKERKSS
jgi:hypothetical protein